MFSIAGRPDDRPTDTRLNWTLDNFFARLPLPKLSPSQHATARGCGLGFNTAVFGRDYSSDKRRQIFQIPLERPRQLPTVSAGWSYPCADCRGELRGGLLQSMGKPLLSSSDTLLPSLFPFSLSLSLSLTSYDDDSDTQVSNLPKTHRKSRMRPSSGAPASAGLPLVLPHSLHDRPRVRDPTSARVHRHVLPRCEAGSRTLRRRGGGGGECVMLIPYLVSDVGC
ncbi:hypothetical protein F5B21DRAFT_467484 [Xylaria acuta]|nr:hypothetical protein F5B21DRAFT_467484 [Xylaria acuta]